MWTEGQFGSGTEKRRKIIVDCDPGIDDAIALMLAFASPDELEILGITAVAGNVPLDMTEVNARRLRDLCGVSAVPVHAGCPRPLLRPLIVADHVHGDTGLAVVDLPPPEAACASAHAVDMLRDTVAAAPGEITVVAVGPLTNIACVLVQRPAFASEVREIIVMGGAAGAGNVTSHAEFNFHVDPHAAHIVMGSGAPIVMYGLDITRQVCVDALWLDRIAELKSPVAQAAAGMLSFYKEFGGALHDVLAIGHLLSPECFRLTPCEVRIVTEEGPRAGRSEVVRDAPKANVLVGFEADADRFLDFLYQRLARYPVNSAA